MTVSDGERKYIETSNECRYDGRLAQDMRHLTVKCGVVPFCNGSSQVGRICTCDSVVAGVKLEVVTLGQSKLNVTVEYGIQSKELAEQVENQLQSINLEIVPGKYFWAISVDIVVLGSDGNICDLIALAVYCALIDAKIPRLTMIDTEQGPDFEVGQDDEPLPKAVLESLPIRLTLYGINGTIVTDVCALEEECAESAISVLVNRQGHLCSTLLMKNTKVQLSKIGIYLGACTRLAQEMFRLLDSEF